MSAMENVREEARTVADLFGDLAHETSTLVRQEVKLATTEVTGKAKYAGTQAAVMAASAVVGAVSFLTFVAALVLGIGELLPLWASALIVGFGLALVAGGLAFAGFTAIKHLDPKPRQTVLELEETTSWMKRQAQQ